MNIHLSHVFGVTKVTIDRPEKRNAISIETANEIIAALSEAVSQRSRAIVITGAGGRVFASGADLEELPEAFSTPESAKNYDRVFGVLYDALRDCPIPTVARVEGYAIGGGWLLALACDFIISSEDTKFGLPVSRIGLMLSRWEHEVILRTMPLSYAKYLIFTGQRITAAQALERGIIQEVVPGTRLDERVLEITNSIVAGAPLANAAAKAILNSIKDSNNKDATLNGAYLSIYKSKDLSEGLAAATARRSPNFVGE